MRRHSIIKKHFFTFVFSLTTYLVVTACLAAEVRELTLFESIELATESSLTLQMEKKKIRSAKLNNENVELSWYPDLLIGASYKYQDNNEGQEYGDLLPFLTLSQVVFNGQESYTKRFEAMNQIISGQEGQYKALNNLYAYTIQKYFSLIQAQTSMHLKESYLNQLEKDFTKLKGKAKTGLISQLELMKNESMLEMVRLETTEEQNRVSLTSFDLASHLNLDVDQRIRAIDSFVPTLESLDFKSYQDFAKTHHPILKLNEKIISEIPSFRKLANLTTWPSVTVSAYVGKGATEWDSESTYSAQVSLSKPLWDFGKSKRRKQILSIELNTMEDMIKKSETELFLHLKKRYVEVLQSGELLRRLTTFQKLADKLKRSTEKNYEMGLISYEELMQQKKKEVRRKIEYQAASNRYLAAEMLLKLNCGIFDSTLLLKEGIAWLEVPKGIDSQTDAQLKSKE